MKIKNSVLDDVIIFDCISFVGAIVLMVMLGRYHFFVSIGMIIVVVSLLVILFIFWNYFLLFSIPIKKSCKLFSSYWQLRKDLYDSAVFSMREYHNADGKTETRAILPKIRFVLVDKNEIQLKIENRPNYEIKLTNLNFGSSLQGWVVNNKYLTNDNHWMIYELMNEDVEQEHFTEYEKFKNWLATYKFSNYSYVLDEYTARKLQSLYVFGVTGSGKSFLVEMLLLELVAQGINDISICDPKNSDLAVMANILHWQLSIDPDSSVTMLANAVQELEQRQTKLNTLMNKDGELAKTYDDYGLKPKIVVIDEVSALVALMNKKQLAQFVAMVKQIVLKGRQLGVYVILIQQKYLSTDMPTSVKENCGVILMGKNGAMTQQTTFNQQLAPRSMPIGSGYVQTPTDIEPRYFYAPYCDFDVLQALQSDCDLQR